MDYFERIKNNYNFTAQDEERVKSIYPLLKYRIDEIIERLEERIKLIVDPQALEIIEAHPKLPFIHKYWLERLLKGPFDKDYYWGLVRAGKVHSSLKISPHYVSVAMNTVRGILMDILSEEVEDRLHRTQLKESLNKILDINLDVITGAYVEEEIMQYSTAYKVKTTLVRFAEGFTGAMNLVLVLALIVITLGVLGLFIYDVISLFHEHFAKGVISALGTLLILWVLIELMNTEISHLKGGKFNISVFIGVALVAFIRDLMIITLKHEKIAFSYYLIATILVLGIVYWLVVRVEEKRG